MNDIPKLHVEVYKDSIDDVPFATDGPLATDVSFGPYGCLIPGSDDLSLLVIATASIFAYLGLILGLAARARRYKSE